MLKTRQHHSKNRQNDRNFRTRDVFFRVTAKTPIKIRFRCHGKKNLLRTMVVVFRPRPNFFDPRASQNKPRVLRCLVCFDWPSGRKNWASVEKRRPRYEITIFVLELFGTFYNQQQYGRILKPSGKREKVLPLQFSPSFLRNICEKKIEREPENKKIL